MIIGGDGDYKRLIKASRKQEKRTAERYRGSRTVNSGSKWYSKNDVRSEHLLIENKLTENTKSYTIKFKDLDELRQRAILDDRLPVLQFDLGGRNFVVLTEEDFLAILNDQLD